MGPDLTADLGPWAAAAALFALVAVRLGGQLTGLVRRRRGRRLLAADDSGTAALEFVLVFPFFLMSALILVQIILAMQGLIVVNYAAFCAARSSSVWSAQPGGHAQGEATSAAVIGVLPVASKAGGSSMRIELLPLLAGNSSTRSVARQLLWVSSKYEWARRATTMTLSTARIGPPKSPFQSTTATVTHQFHLAVPYAGEILGAAVGARFRGKPVMPMKASATLLIEGKVRSRMKLKGKQTSWLFG